MNRIQAFQFTYSVKQSEPGKHTDWLGYNHDLKIIIGAAPKEDVYDYLRKRHAHFGEAVEGVKTLEMGQVEIAQFPFQPTP